MSFKKVAAKIARKGGYSKKAASAILASASRKASEYNYDVKILSTMISEETE